MKKWNILICSLLALVMLAACGNQADEQTTKTYVKKAEEIVALLNHGEFEAITEQFDATMAANVTAVQLAEITPVLEQSGAFEQIEKQSVEEKDAHKIVVLVAKHMNDKRIYTVTFNEQDQVAGLFVQ